MVKILRLKPNRVLFGALILCILLPKETFANDIIDANYSCEMRHMSVDYKQNGKLLLREEYKGSELDLALDEMGESRKFVWSARNGKGYFHSSKGKKEQSVPLVRKGNKLFFEASPYRVSTSDGTFVVKMRGFLDLKTNKFLQTIHTYSKDNTVDVKGSISGLCL